MDNLSQILRLQSELLTAAVEDSSHSIDFLTEYFMGLGQQGLIEENQEFMEVIAKFQFYDRLSQRIEVVSRVLEQIADNAERHGQVMIDQIDAEALIHKVESLFDSRTVAHIFSSHGFSEEAKQLQEKSSAVKSSSKIDLF